jgi:hypothetical protein
MALRHNPYGYRRRASQASSALGFQDVSANYLKIAQGNNVESDGDSDHPNKTRRRSWTREQKLGAVNYASITYKTSKDGQVEPISRNIVADNIECTTKIL